METTLIIVRKKKKKIQIIQIYAYINARNEKYKVIINLLLVCIL